MRSVSNPAAQGAGASDGDLDSDGVSLGTPRPQTLLLTFFGGYVLGRDVLVATTSILRLLGRAGVSEHATRSTLSRMVQRGLLHRVRSGRKVYIGLTERSREVLREGEIRIWRIGAVNEHWDGTWTLLAFSLPESWQRQRHLLRSRLIWAGFGSLQGGLWIAPSTVDISAMVEDLDVADYLKVFHARAMPPTEVDDLVRDTWELDSLAARYHAFLDRWDRPNPAPELPDGLVRQLLLQTEWLQLIRRDPRLPTQHLPADWPAERAQRVFRSLHAEFEPTARALAGQLLDVIPDADAPGETPAVRAR